jgi:sigma-B regulation protein RsbU (phosphoserine phosphatase)
MPLLRVEQKHEKPFEIDLNKDAFTIGRSSANDLTFNNLSLSRHHARIIRKDEKFFVEDTGSRNGTFLNGVRIRQASPLKNEDVIQLGEITIRYLSPISDRIEVRDTAPALGMEATFMIDTDELNIRRYTEEAISGITPVTAGENLWPALQQAAATLITHYPIEKLVEVIMDIVFEAVPAERGALIMLDPKNPRELELKVVRNAHADQNLQISRTIIDEVMRNQKAVLTLDAQADERFGSAHSIQMQGIRSIICVPLWNEKNVIGLIYIDNLISRRTFTQSDLRLIALIANMAAVKIENALLLEEQLEKKRIEEQLAVAAQIQRRLLPQMNPENPNYEIYGVNHSCYQIGGDYYDFIDKGNSKLAVVIADVSGKGVGAALLMAAFQASIRTLVKGEENPASLMAHLNNVMFENSPPNKYITVFYGEIDTLNHTFEYVNAGHNPALYVKTDGHELLGACGPVIGIIANAQYKSAQIRMDVNDLLFLYTDGITEAVDPEEKEFGEDGVLKVLMSNRNSNVEDLAHLLERNISDFTKGAPPLDDSTLIFVRRVS